MHLCSATATWVGSYTVHSSHAQNQHQEDMHSTRALSFGFGSFISLHITAFTAHQMKHPQRSTTMRTVARRIDNLHVLKDITVPNFSPRTPRIKTCNRPRQPAYVGIYPTPANRNCQAKSARIPSRATHYKHMKRKRRGISKGKY